MGGQKAKSSPIISICMDIHDIEIASQQLFQMQTIAKCESQSKPIALLKLVLACVLFASIFVSAFAHVLKPTSAWLFPVECFFSALFLVHFLLLLRVRSAMSPLLVVDFVSILPLLLEFILSSPLSSTSTLTAVSGMISTLRFFRLAKFIRFLPDVRGTLTTASRYPMTVISFCVLNALLVSFHLVNPAEINGKLSDISSISPLPSSQDVVINLILFGTYFFFATVPKTISQIDRDTFVVSAFAFFALVVFSLQMFRFVSALTPILNLPTTPRNKFSKIYTLLQPISLYSNALETHPLLTKFVTSSILFSIGDLLAQFSLFCPSILSCPPSFLQFFLSSPAPLAHNIDVAIFGGVSGIACHYWFSFLQNKFSAPSLLSVLMMVALDQICYSPISTCVFFLWTSFMQRASVSHALEVAFQNVVPTLQLNWLVWPFIQIVNFWIVPLRLRVLVVNVMCVVWSAVLSATTSTN
eukprot:c13612_g1_i1.p1 GENE.c13612_g1_i1~~c13612_g1_i1.p1  ORF type:complete len:470 (-),score=85.78 c13612_g1_i1:93-1502(-)